MRLSRPRGSWRRNLALVENADASAERAPQFLRQAQKCRIALHKTLAAIGGRHRYRRSGAAWAERDEAIENGFVRLAKQFFVTVRSDPEIEGAVAVLRVVIDDVADQDEPGTVTRNCRHRVGVEHHREKVTLGDAGEQRDHLAVIFQGVYLDHAPAICPRRYAGVANEMLDAGLGEHIWQFLFRHPQRLDPEERIDQALDVGVARGPTKPITRPRLLFVFL